MFSQRTAIGVFPGKRIDSGLCVDRQGFMNFDVQGDSKATGFLRRLRTDGEQDNHSRSNVLQLRLAQNYVREVRIESLE